MFFHWTYNKKSYEKRAWGQLNFFLEVSVLTDIITILLTPDLWSVVYNGIGHIDSKPAYFQSSIDQ